MKGWGNFWYYPIDPSTSLKLSQNAKFTMIAQAKGRDKDQ